MTLESITSIVDSCIGKDTYQIESKINNLLDSVIPHILLSYDNSRAFVQYTLGQLDRIHQNAAYIMMTRILHHIEDLCGKFEKGRDEDFLNEEWKDDDIKKILEIASSHYSGDVLLNIANISFAQNLSTSERRKLSSYINDSIQRHGINTHWTKDIIETHIHYMAFLYAICKEESQMWFFFILQTI